MKYELRKIHNCRICGEPVKDYPNHDYCYGCVVDEIYERISNGLPLNTSIRKRASSKNIVIKEIREAVKCDKDSVASWIFTDYGNAIRCSKCGCMPRTTTDNCPACKRKMI